MATIMVNTLTKMAMTDSDGLKLRKEIEDLKKTEKNIILDFSQISLFATMFFNASIGHFIMEMSPEKCEDLFELRNISELGKETYNHSFENAKILYQNKKQENFIGEITQQNIEHL